MKTTREGFTFIELLMILLLGMILLGAVYDTMIKQEHAYGLMNAVAGTQHDARLGIDLLTSELRELSSGGGDLLMATGDSVRIRALRKFGLVCTKNKPGNKLTVARMGVGHLSVGDSILVYVDQDSLKAADDIWQRAYVSSVTSTTLCGTTLGINLALLFPTSDMVEVMVGNALRYDSIFAGAPVRSFETLTYRTGTISGETWVQRVQSDTITPLIGPVPATNGFKVSYYDTLGTALTAFPLSAADREGVHRMRIEIRARRRAGTPGTTYTDSLITDIYLRGS